MNKVVGSIAGAAGLIAVLTLASRLVGFVRTVGESWVLGATPMADAYASANNIPNILFEIAAGGALAGVVVPVLSSMIVGKQDVSRVASAFLTWVLVVSVPVALLVVVCADPIARLIVGGTHPDTVEMAGWLLRIFAIQVPLYGLSVPLTGILQAHKRFVLPALAPLLSSLVVIASFGLYWYTGGARAHAPGDVPTGALMWLGWGTTAGVAMFSLPQIIPVARLVKIRPTLRFPDGVGRRVLALAGAGFGSLLAHQAAILVIMLVANGAGGGVFPVYKYAQAMYFLPYAILAVPISVALYPKIAERASVDCEGLGSLVSGSIRLVVAVSAAGAGLLFAVAEPAAAILSHIHVMPGLGPTMSIMAGAVIGYSLLYHLTRVLFAIGSGRGAMVMACLGWGSVIVGALVTGAMATSAQATLVGLAGSLCAGMCIAAVAGLGYVGQILGGSALDGLGRAILVGVVAGAIGGGLGRVSASLVTSFAGDGLISQIGAAGLAGVLALGCAAILVKVADERTWKVYRWVT